MKKNKIIAFFILISFVSFAQQATEIDSKSVRFPRYSNLTAITTAISSPTQGMEVYNIATQSNWYFNGTGWTNTNAGGFVLPYAQTQNITGDLFSITNTANSSFSNVNAITGIFNGTNTNFGIIPSGVKGIVPNSASLIVGTAAGVYGYGQNPNSYGVYGESNGYYGVKGKSTGSGYAGVFGESDSGTGVTGISNSSVGGSFASSTGNGVEGTSTFLNGGVFTGNSNGVRGNSFSGHGGKFLSETGSGILASSTSGTGGSFSSISGNALVTTAGNIVLGGFTQLGGTDATVPKIKIKKLTGTTPNTANSYLPTAHGIADASKILSIQAVVTNGIYQFIPNTRDRYFTVNVDGNNIQIGVGSTAESSFVMGMPVKILITYEE